MRLRQQAGSDGPRGIAFAGAFAFSTQRFDLSRRAARSQPVNGLVASGGFFTTLGVRALLGRTFTSADDVRGGGPDGPVVVISHCALAAALRRRPDVIGKPLHVERVPFTIVGVTPPRVLRHRGRPRDSTSRYRSASSR